MLAIAVLHPKQVVVYTLEGVTSNSNNSTTPSYFKLVKKYKHSLGIDGEHFTACNMITGRFGNVAASGNYHRNRLSVVGPASTSVSSMRRSIFILNQTQRMSVSLAMDRYGIPR